MKNLVTMGAAFCIKRPRLLYIFPAPYITNLELIDNVDPFYSKPSIFHFFVIDEHSVTETLRMIKILNFRQPERYKFCIHIPWPVKELRTLVRHMFAEIMSRKIMIMREYYGIYFAILGTDIRPHSGVGAVYIHWDDDHLYADIPYLMSPFAKKRSGYFANESEERHPELFKDEIIANFKATTPLGILKTFKSEEDIWNYIVAERNYRTATEALGGTLMRNIINLDRQINEQNNAMIDDVLKNIVRNKNEKEE